MTTQRKKSKLLTESELIVDIAQALEPYDIERKGWIMAAVACQFGYYDLARQAISLAENEALKRHTASAKRAARRARAKAQP